MQIPPELWVFLVSMTPIAELRGAIPLAFSMNMNPWEAYAISVMGNLVPVPLILGLLQYAERYLRRYDRWEKFFTWLFAWTREKATNRIRRGEEIGLIAFVAIPLPITGAWTGSLLAYLFGLRQGRSFSCIAIGVAIAGVIVSLACEGLIWIWHL